MTTKQVELIRKKEFVAAALDPEHEAFVVHIAAFSIDPGDEVHLSRRAQVAYLKADDTLTKVSSEYSNFADVFCPKLATKLSKYTRINDHIIELVDDWQLPYGPIYNLGSVELKMLKAYIENNLANSFIRSFKLPAKALIFFNKKSNSSLRICVNYQGLNNLTIKYRYPLPLVRESLDWLGQARQFT